MLQLLLRFSSVVGAYIGVGTNV